MQIMVLPRSFMVLPKLVVWLVQKEIYFCKADYLDFAQKKEELSQPQTLWICMLVGGYAGARRLDCYEG